MQGYKIIWLSISVIFMVIAVSFFLPLLGNTSKAFTYVGSNQKPAIETLEVPSPVGVSSAQIIGSLYSVSLMDYAIKVKQTTRNGSTEELLISNDQEASTEINKIKRNTMFSKKIQRDTSGAVQLVTFTEL